MRTSRAALLPGRGVGAEQSVGLHLGVGRMQHRAGAVDQRVPLADLAHLQAHAGDAAVDVEAGSVVALAQRAQAGRRRCRGRMGGGCESHDTPIFATVPRLKPPYDPNMARFALSIAVLGALVLPDLALAQAGGGSGGFGGGGGGGGGGFSGGGGGSFGGGGSGGSGTATAPGWVVVLFFGFFGFLVLWLLIRSAQYNRKVKRRTATVRRASAEAAEDDPYFASDRGRARRRRSSSTRPRPRGTRSIVRSSSSSSAATCSWSGPGASTTSSARAGTTGSRCSRRRSSSTSG